MNYQTVPPYGRNKFMYVKQGLLDGIKQNQQSKVLINPNFIQSSLVKPHFNKQFLKNQTIHVNPNIFKTVEKPSIINAATKMLRLPAKAKANNMPLISSRSKLVRVPNREEKGRSRRISIHTKYKIIRQPFVIRSPDKQANNIKKLYYIKNRYKIDHVSRQSSKTMLNSKNVIVKCNSQLKNSSYVSINGILYRKSAKSLVKNQLEKRKFTLKGNEQLLSIRGQKYKLDSNHKTLTLVNGNKSNFKSISVGRITFKQKEPNVFIKTDIHRTFALMSQARQRSINTLVNKMKKSNIPCPFYRRFGKCKRYEMGTCIRCHNPDQISLCPKFLQGACINDKCLLSHKVSAEKMPTCKFFLDGFCTRDDCPYLHVKINEKADICKDFLQGFCKKATECDKRHQYLCPDYEKVGVCLKMKCQHPHGSSTNFTTKTQMAGPEKGPNIRYYDESMPCTSLENKINSQFEIVDLDVQESEHNTNKRAAIGNLPSFIPLHN